MRVVKLPISVGFSWIGESFRLFRAQPGAWVSLASLWLLISLFLMILPGGLGAALAQMAQPAFFAGFVLACRDQLNNKPISARHLFAGLKANARLFIMLGAITLLLESLLMMGFTALGLFDAMRDIDLKNLTAIEAAREMQRALLSQGDLVLGLLFALFVLKALLWFSAAMIAYRPMPAFQAVRWSIAAFFANVLPLLFFAVLLFVLLTLAMLPWGLGLLVFFPLYAIVHYVSFAATFDDSDEFSGTGTTPPAAANDPNIPA